MVAQKGMLQGLLDEVEFLQNHLGLLDLDEVSEELPHRGAEIRQHSPNGLHCTADGLQEGRRLLPQPGERIPTPLLESLRYAQEPLQDSGPDALFWIQDLQTGRYQRSQDNAAYFLPGFLK